MKLIKKKLRKLLEGLYQEKSVTLKFKKLNGDAKVPEQAHFGDAGIDLFSVERVYLPAFQYGIVNTGLAVEIPEGWHMQIHTRSSYGKRGVRCHLGIIDSGYRGEVKVIVQNHGTEDFVINKGDKFCQGVLVPTPFIKMEEVNELSKTTRGYGGLGSTGK